MPRYDYECKRGHVIERSVPLAKAPGPVWIRCNVRVCSSPKGHQPDCYCGLRANRRQVYRVAVSGDLPTRGAF